MLSFDARTVILVAFLTNSLFFIILFALDRSLARPLPGLRIGVWAALCWSTGAGLILARGAIPDILSIVVGNMAITGGILFMHYALQTAARGSTTQPRWLAITAIPGTIVMLLLFIFGNYSDVLFFFTAYNTMIYFACFIVACKTRPVNFATSFTALALGFACFVSGTRFLLLAIGSAPAAPIYDPSLIQRAYFSLIAFAIISTLLGFTLMTYERLNNMLFATKTALESEVIARTMDLRIEIERKQALERLVSSTADTERRRIGNELHDDLGQRLTGISLVAEVLARELTTGGHRLSAHADTIQKAASEAIVQVRGLAHGLMPVSPEPQGFSEALALLAETSSVSGLLCKLECDEPVDIKNQDVATNLFRIAQEAVSNAIRHAGAKVITMRLDLVNGKVRFSIADDGCGFEWPKLALEPGGGRGIGIMEFRASLIHYRLEIQSSPGRGSIIRVIEC